MTRYDPSQQERLAHLSDLRRVNPYSLELVAMEAERIAREQGMEWTYSYVLAAVLEELDYEGGTL